MSNDSPRSFKPGGWMQKLGWAIALTTLTASCVQLLLPAHPALADEGESDETAEDNGRLGLCALRDESAGRWVHNGRGQLVPLREICDDPNAWASYVASFEDELNSVAAVTDNPDVNHLDMDNPAIQSERGLTPEQEFWLRFRMVASNEALEFARSLELSAVIDYGQTICPLLNDGITMDEVRDTQIEADLPADFDAAVNVAAIHTYCPQQVTQIGR